MNHDEAFDTIDFNTFNALLEEYPNRYDAIPQLLKEREDSPCLSKAQVSSLVDWKLSHGKFRPALKGLVQQNDETLAVSTTENAFTTFSSSAKDAKAVKEALNILTALRGIGPATASLLLAVFDSDTVPFFSDELFRWCFFEVGKGQGWDREIKYSIKEYLELFDEVSAFRTRLAKNFERDVTAVEIEKVAYVLGKRFAGGGSPDSQSEKKAKANRKRKAESPFMTDASDHRDDAQASPKTGKAGMPATKKLQAATAETTAATGRPRRKMK
ncbi:hypothetical protein LTR37_010487 [Vermiconidia calcicola]|uniref:Uncharacterized protein n=1 Tax=Vermiconidia calcicola TaxID=1690605 RepID=A0ACC3N519_9PEZI|nr:hypothetical protein LTR37_010487 [Vermiconidia calcicola]